MQTIHCISGLGADEKAFAGLNIPGFQQKHIPWLEPLNGESIGDYAIRMSGGVTEPAPILLGLSFGGMIAIEMSKLIPVKKVILISSIKTVDEMPRWMRIAGFCKLNKIIPIKPYRFLEPIQNRRLGLQSAEEIAMVKKYREETSLTYLGWAVNQILNWDNTWLPSKIYHIHGDKDQIFPINKIRPTHVVNGGSHFMIVNRAADVSKLLCEILVA